MIPQAQATQAQTAQAQAAQAQAAQAQAARAVELAKAMAAAAARLPRDWPKHHPPANPACGETGEQNDG